MKTQDKQYAVIKCINISKLDNNERKDALQEAKILEVCKHPNIPTFLEGCFSGQSTFLQEASQHSNNTPPTIHIVVDQQIHQQLGLHRVPF